MKKFKQDIFGYPFEATEKQLKEIYNLTNEEDYTNPKFQKYT